MTVALFARMLLKQCSDIYLQRPLHEARESEVPVQNDSKKKGCRMQ